MMPMLGTLARLSVVHLSPDSIRLEPKPNHDPDDLVAQAHALGDSTLHGIAACPFELTDTFDDRRRTVVPRELGTFIITSHVHQAPPRDSAWNAPADRSARLGTVFISSPDLPRPVTLRILKTR